MAGTWTEASIPDLSGRTAIVTGANSGIGFEATRLFAAKGADVVMAVRSPERGEEAAEDLRGGLDGTLEVRELDLADLDSVEAFANAFRDEYDELQYLCNNAGVMAIPREETVDGFETQFGVNHLGHFAVTGHLLDLLRETPEEGRVITQSSGMHERGEIDFDDLHHEADYDRWEAYAQSKLANVLFAYELQRRLEAVGEDSVTSVAVHPGYADTNLQYRGPEQAGSRLRLWLMKVANTLFAQSPKAGAWPMLYAATVPSIEGGEYVGPKGLFDMRGPPGVQESSDLSYDEALAGELWDVSVELTGVEYDLD
jgi:NAD(P)-dependent dehydrogenase (short-subunit alcohol dehydrogenase family)